MKVRCIATDMRQVGLSDARLRSLGLLRDYNNGPRFLTVGVNARGLLSESFSRVPEHTVYGIRIKDGFQYLLLARHYDRRPVDWGFAPALCFEVIDGRPSSYWRFRHSVRRWQDQEILLSELAIPEWLAQDDFHFQLVETREREMAIMANAAALMDAEFA